MNSKSTLKLEEKQLKAILELDSLNHKAQVVFYLIKAASHYYN